MECRIFNSTDLSLDVLFARSSLSSSIFDTARYSRATVLLLRVITSLLIDWMVAIASFRSSSFSRSLVSGSRTDSAPTDSILLRSDLT